MSGLKISFRDYMGKVQFIIEHENVIRQHR